MSHSNLHFATMINCIDGRTQKPVSDWIKKELCVEFVDAVNVAGPTNVITKGVKEVVENLKEEVSISVSGHSSTNVVVIAHQDCAKNPISDEAQISELNESCELIANDWGVPKGVSVIGLWLEKNSDFDWSIKKLTEIVTS